MQAGSSITNRQTGAETAVARHFITPTLPAASAATRLLVVNRSTADGVTSITGHAGWIQAASISQAGEGTSEIWYYPNNPGGTTNPTFTVSLASKEVFSQMTERNAVAAS